MDKVNEIYQYQLKAAQEFLHENHYADVARLQVLLQKMMPVEYHEAILALKEGKNIASIEISHSQVSLAPSASTAIQQVFHDGHPRNLKEQIHKVQTEKKAVRKQTIPVTQYSLYVQHDNVGVRDLIKKAQKYIVMHAAYYPKYGFDNQGLALLNTMRNHKNLKLHVIFTDDNAVWLDEFAQTLRPYFTEAEGFRTEKNISQKIFTTIQKECGKDRVVITNSGKLPLEPILMIDNTLVVGHYAHSGVIAPDGLWLTIHNPRIVSMYESLLKGKANTKKYTDEELAIFRYVEELYCCNV